MKTFNFLAGALSLLLALTVPALAADSPKATELFARVDQHYDQIQSLHFKVERTLERGMQKQEEHWEVFTQKPDRIRVEYDGPPQRIVLSRGDFYSEYIPQAKKALELEVNRMSEKARAEMFNALMPRVAIPGFRLGFSDEQLKKIEFQPPTLEERNGRPCYQVSGKERGTAGKGEVSTIRLWIDRERNVLMRLEMYRGENFLSSIENQAFTEFARGRFLPNRVAVQNNGPSGLEKATYRLTKITANDGLSQDLFATRYAEGTVITRPPVAGKPAT